MNAEALKKYIGTKEVMAAPMDEATAVAKGFARKNEDNHEWRPGFHVLYNNPDGSTYDSWSPADVFNQSYKIADDFYDRLNIELNDVTERFVKLEKFMNKGLTAVCEKVGDYQASILVAQYHAMKMYKSCLEERIKEIEKREVWRG